MDCGLFELARNGGHLPRFCWAKVGDSSHRSCYPAYFATLEHASFNSANCTCIRKNDLTGYALGHGLRELFNSFFGMACYLPKKPAVSSRLLVLLLSPIYLFFSEMSNFPLWHQEGPDQGRGPTSCRPLERCSGVCGRHWGQTVRNLEQDRGGHW